MEMGLPADTIIFVLALFLLIKGADWFVEAAEKIGLSLGINSFILGMTVVAMGTSLPELGSSIAAVYAGDPQIVIGNVVGSNTTNILLVMGVMAVMGKVVPLGRNLMDVDVPLLLASAFFLYFALADLHFGIFEAILFLVALVAFLTYSVQSNQIEVVQQDRPPLKWKHFMWLIVGGVLLFFGSKYTITGLQGIAEHLNIGTSFLAFTILALGTSLPEVFVSLSAARKGNTGIAIGNILGSNVFNTYAVLGIPALITDIDVPAASFEFAVPFMVAVTLMFAVISFSGRVNRYEGIVLLLLYVFYIYKMSVKVI